MRLFLFVSTLLVFSFISTACDSTQKEVKDYEATFVSLVDNNDLQGIESSIRNAFNQAFMQQNTDALNSVISQLESMQNNDWVSYWKAYALYRKAIYHTVNKEKELSETTTEAAFSTIESVKEKTSEHFALQAMIRSFSIQFTQGMKAGIVAQRVTGDLKRAIKLDDKNLRAYYAKGSQDYYTPEKYGGGKEVEEYLKKAIELKDQYHSNTVMPTWGKDEAYELLLKYYIKKEQFEKAKELFQEATTAFPENYQLTKLGVQLVNK